MKSIGNTGQSLTKLLKNSRISFQGLVIFTKKRTMSCKRRGTGARKRPKQKAHNFRAATKA
ncbi:hypothetical protein LB505_006343 [Fusarium chuoi]|nr:hypothetical protein LB505_006343 [Fusarium chuoi]